MLHLSEKSNLVYSFVLLAIVVALLAFLLFYFLYYEIKKTESIPVGEVKSTIIEIDPNILSPNSNNMKGGEDI